VHEDVQAAERLHRGVDGVPAPLRGGEVGYQSGRTVAQSVELLLPGVDDDQLRAAGDELRDAGGVQAARAEYHHPAAGGGQW
jgi:hypothetical protein